MPTPNNNHIEIYAWNIYEWKSHVYYMYDIHIKNGQFNIWSPGDWSLQNDGPAAGNIQISYFRY